LPDGPPAGCPVRHDASGWRAAAALEAEAFRSQAARPTEDFFCKSPNKGMRALLTISVDK
jgi:hypothetical protein